MTLPPKVQFEHASERVLVFVDCANIACWLIGWYDYALNEWIVDDDWNWPSESVTHWMPLPDAPTTAPAGTAPPPGSASPAASTRTRPGTTSSGQ